MDEADPKGGVGGNGDNDRSHPVGDINQELDIAALGPGQHRVIVVNIGDVVIEIDRREGRAFGNRDPDRIEHTVDELVAQRDDMVFG